MKILQTASLGTLQNDPRFPRRRFLFLSAALGAMSLARSNALAGAISGDPPGLGMPRRPYGYRSPFEKNVVRSLSSGQFPDTGSAHTPLQDLYGIITPAALHFERIHAGVPADMIREAFVHTTMTTGAWASSVWSAARASLRRVDSSRTTMKSRA